MDWETFKKWLAFQCIDIDRISWKQSVVLYKDFENEKKQNSFSYRKALDKE